MDRLTPKLKGEKIRQLRITIADGCVTPAQATVHTGDHVVWCTSDDQEYKVTVPFELNNTKAKITVPAKGCSVPVEVKAGGQSGFRYAVTPGCDLTEPPKDVRISITDGCVKPAQASVHGGDRVLWCSADDREYQVMVSEDVFARAVKVKVPAESCSAPLQVKRDAKIGISQYVVSPACVPGSGVRLRAPTILVRAHNIPSGTPTIMVEN